MVNITSPPPTKLKSKSNSHTAPSSPSPKTPKHSPTPKTRKRKRNDTHIQMPNKTQKIEKQTAKPNTIFKTKTHPHPQTKTKKTQRNSKKRTYWKRNNEGIWVKMRRPRPRPRTTTITTKPKTPPQCSFNTHEIVHQKCLKKCEENEIRNNNDICVKNVLLDKKHFRTIKDYLVELKLPIITENSVEDKNVSYVQDLQKIGKLYEITGIDYQNQYFGKDKTLYSRVFSYMYLIEKYGMGCLMFDYQPTFDIKKEENEKKEKFIRQILHCIKDNKHNPNFVMIIPIAFETTMSGEQKRSSHANMLIYKSAINTIEHFEPHGQYYQNNKEYKEFNEKIVSFFRNIITEMNSTNMEKNRVYYENDIQYIEPFQLCPIRAGFQMYDEYSKRQEEKRSLPKKTKDEGAGFCAMWSLFYAELSLLNPTVDGNTILKSILDWIKKDNENKKSVRNIIRGYIHIILQEIKEFENEFIKNYLNYTYDLSEKEKEYVMSKYIGNFYEFIQKKYNEYNKTKFEEIFETSINEYVKRKNEEARREQK